MILWTRTKHEYEKLINYFNEGKCLDFSKIEKQKNMFYYDCNSLCQTSMITSLPTDEMKWSKNKNGSLNLDYERNFKEGDNCFLY